MSHIRKDHPNFRELHENFGFGTPGVTKKALNYSRWIEGTIIENRKYGFCDKLLTRKFTNLQPISNKPGTAQVGAISKAQK